MSTPIYIGDEVSSAGFRLAGLRVRVAAKGEWKKELEWSMEQTQLVLISSAVASEIPMQELDHYLSRLSPAIVVVPDVHGAMPMMDLSTRLRKQLGMQE
jgi:vacuolar-type H+-ATPase subunit F/Vma7